LSIFISAQDPSSTLESVTGTPEPDLFIALDAVDIEIAAVSAVIDVVLVVEVFKDVAVCAVAALLQPNEVNKVGTITSVITIKKG
jgi:hypothetical protein